MLGWSAELAGQREEHVITSDLLRDNPPGDPRERPLQVYLPPGYGEDPGRRYPAVYVVQQYCAHLRASTTGSRSRWHGSASASAPETPAGSLTAI